MRNLCVLTSMAMSFFLCGVLATPGVAAQGDPQAGKATYDKTCGMCHGPTGRGMGLLRQRFRRNHGTTLMGST